MVVTGEGLVKGCLKYRKGFDMALIGMDVLLKRILAVNKYRDSSKRRRISNWSDLVLKE